MELTKLEEITQPQLTEAYGEGDGDALWGGYMVARQRAVNDILPFIKQFEPNLTDHGQRHIQDVLDNAFALLGDTVSSTTQASDGFNANELYFLVLAILHHDLGNIHGRSDHNRRLEAIYEFTRGDDTSLLPEKRHLLTIVEAHCGQTRDGSRDTIGRLDKASSFRRQLLNCQRVAAVLRFADELAEGPQRTSLFMQKHFPLSQAGEVFHDYANITDVCIDRAGERIVLTYDIDIQPPSWQGAFNEVRLGKLLELCYARAVKLDLERKYNRHFCSLLAPFKKTEVSFHFYFQGQDIRLGIQKIVLDDLVLPASPDSLILIKKEQRLDLTWLMPRLREASAAPEILFEQT
jgi:hypothetical protein